MTLLKLRTATLTAPFTALAVLAGTAISLACNTSEAPQPHVSAEQPPAQVVTASAPVTASPVVVPPANEAAAQPGAVGSGGGASPSADNSATTGPAGAKATAEGAAAPTAGATRGPAANNDTYATWLETFGNYTAGQAGQVRLVLEAKAPYHTNEEYPYKFTFGAPVGGVSYPTPVVKEMNIAEMTASMPLPIQATSKGAATVQGTFNFSVCSKDKCLIEKATLTLPIEIK